MRPGAADLCLLVRAGEQLYALPLEHVEETMRPLAVRRLAGVPPFVRGLAVVRGVPVPVVDLTSVVGRNEPSSQVMRFVALKLADRRVALAVDEVFGVRQIDRTQLSHVPPLLSAAGEHVVRAIGTLDAELLMVLRSGKLIPEDVWTAIVAGETA